MLELRGGARWAAVAAAGVGCANSIPLQGRGFSRDRDHGRADRITPNNSEVDRRDAVAVAAGQPPRDQGRAAPVADIGGSRTTALTLRPEVEQVRCDAPSGSAGDNRTVRRGSGDATGGLPHIQAQAGSIRTSAGGLHRSRPRHRISSAFGHRSRWRVVRVDVPARGRVR